MICRHSKTLENPLDCKEIQPVNPKGNQSWIFIGRTDAEAEAPILWPPDVKSWLIWKDPDDEKDWRQEEKGTTEDEIVGWHHQLNGHEFEQALGDAEGQGILACCSPWGHKESDRTEQLNNKGTFLAVQRLRLCTVNAKATGLISGPVTGIPHAVRRGRRKHLVYKYSCLKSLLGKNR